MTRKNIIGEIENFVNQNYDVCLLLIGNPGMGKTWIIDKIHKEFRKNKNVSIIRKLTIERGDTPDHQSIVWLNEFKDKFMLIGPDDRNKIREVLGLVPLVGGFLKVIIDESHTSERDKLIKGLSELCKRMGERGKRLAALYAV